MFKKVTAVALSLSLFVGLGTAKASTQTHKVKAGDTLYKLSREYDTTINELATINSIRNVNLIYVGQVLKLSIQKETPSLSSSEFDLMSRIVEAEAKGESMKGKIAVANVVLNRVAHDQFPNDIPSVIYQKGQFSPVANGTINQSASDESKQAVREALAGNNPVGDSLFFWATHVPRDSWVWTREVTVQIGNHVFAK